MIKNTENNKIPVHVAIMMDGNGRWAKKRLLPREAGHRAGANALKNLVPKAEEAGIKFLTVFAFSTENWSRSEDEVNALMNLLREFIQEYIDDTQKNDVKINIIGDISRLDLDLQEKINYLRALTNDKTGICLNIALNYGGRDEIIRAVKKVSDDVVCGKLSLNEINEKTFASYLDTAGLPEIDLWIRTGGDIRLSNFLLYQLAYTEIYFTKVLWPDFKFRDLNKAIDEFNKRERRYGGR